MDVAVFELRVHLAAETKQAILRWAQGVPQIFPGAIYGRFGIEPLIATSRDIPPCTPLQYVIDSGDILGGELARADQGIGADHRTPKIARECPLFERACGGILGIFEVRQDQAEVAIKRKDGLGRLERYAGIGRIST